MAAGDPQLRADAQRNRETVLAAAIGLLSESPDASMQEIADASGLGRTTVYRHFPAREDLIRAIYRRVDAFADQRMEAILSGTSSAREILRQLGAAVAEISARYPFLYANRHVEYPTVEHPEEPANLLFAWMRVAHAAGALRQEIDSSLQYRLFVAMSVAAWGEIRHGRLSRDEVAHQLGETLVHAFAADDAAPGPGA